MATAAHESQSHAARQAARRSPSRTASSTCRTSPIIPFIEGDGTGPDIWRASVRVMDAAVAEGLRRQDARSTGWKSTPARSRSSCSTTGCPTKPSTACREYLVSIKGPLTTPIGGGIRSLNVALRQMLDLYVCLRPVRWFKGVPSPVKHPEKVDMVIFRENTEDIYAGIEFEHGTEDNKKFLELFKAGVPEGVRQDPLSRTPPASASSRCRRKAPSACSARRSSTRSRTSARA